MNFEELKAEVTTDIVASVLTWDNFDRQIIRKFLPDSIRLEIEEYFINWIDFIVFKEYSYYKNSSYDLMVINCQYDGDLKYEKGSSSKLMEIVSTENVYFDFKLLVQIPHGFGGNLNRDDFNILSDSVELEKYLLEKKYKPIK